MAEGLGDFLLAAQEQALDTERADFDRMQGTENHIQGNPVRGIAHNQACNGEDPVALVEKPDRHLNQAEEEAEVESGVDDKLELLFAALQENPVEQLFILDQLPGHHGLDVEKVFDIATDIDHQVVDQDWNVLPYPLVHHVLDGLGQVFPEGDRKSTR